MRRKVCYSPNWEINNFDSPTEYVKQLLDSVDCGVHPGYSYPELAQKVDGIRSIIGIYKAEKSEKNKQAIANAVVKLLDDPIYASDAIPVAAELGLEEARDWFLELIKRDVDSIRTIKTNNFSGGIGCVIVYADSHKEFAKYLKNILIDNKLKSEELLSVLFRIGVHYPDEIVNNIGEFEKFIFEDVNESNVLQKIKFAFKGAFSKFGDGYSIDIAKNIKPKLKKEQHLLFIKALEEYIGRFDKYLPEIRKILEIEAN